MTGYVVFLAPFALLTCAVRAFSRRARTDEAGGDGRLEMLVVAMFVASYGPYLVAAIATSRVAYIYYFLSSIPAVALAIPVLGARAPRYVRWGFVVVMLVAFGASFPFRG